MLPGATREIAEAAAKRIQEDFVTHSGDSKSVISIGIVDCQKRMHNTSGESQLKIVLHKVAEELNKAKKIGLNAICCEALG